MPAKNIVVKYDRSDLDRLKKPFFDIEKAKQAEKIDSTAGGYVITLCKLGVCGCGSNSTLYTVVSLLKKIKVEHNVNKHGIIWIDNISDALRSHFAGKK